MTETTHNFFMKTKIDWEMGTKIAMFALAAAAVYLGMKFIFPIALPFFLALILARMLYPLAEWIEKKLGRKRLTARFSAYILFLAGVGIIAAALFYLCYRMGGSCLEQIGSFLEQAGRLFSRCCDRFEQITGIRMDELEQAAGIGAGELTESAVAYSKDAGWHMMGFLAKLFVAFVAAFLMLIDYEKIISLFQKTAAGRHALNMLREMKAAAKAYFRAQLGIMGVVMSVCVGGLFLLGMKSAVGIGIFIGICDALPFIGTGIILVPWALAEALLGSYGKAAGLIGIYSACSFIRQILEPKLVGKRLGVPPLAVLMSIYIGIQLFGGMGILLGPVSALILFEVYKCIER